MSETEAISEKIKQSEKREDYPVQKEGGITSGKAILFTSAKDIAWAKKYLKKVERPSDIFADAIIETEAQLAQLA